MKRDPNRTEVPIGNKVPATTDPAAMSYQQRLRSKKAGDPRGGNIPMPSIPRFDKEPPQGRVTMQQAAQQQQGLPPLMLADSDVLPDAAKKDQRFVQGFGSELAVNNPALAAEYGVMRQGQYIPPPQLVARTGAGPQRGAFRPETIQGIEQLQKMEAEKRAAAERSVEEEAKDHTATARLAGEVDEPPVDTEKAKAAVDKMDDLDFYNFTQAMMRDLINNDQQRKLIESRLEEIDITDLILGDYSQKVPIRPGKFEPEFELIAGHNDLAMKKLIAEEARQLDVNERYLLDKFAMMQLAAGVKAIGSLQMPEYRDGEGVLVPELFWKRFNKIASLPTPILASLGANFFWFDVRCRKACTAEELKNG